VVVAAIARRWSSGAIDRVRTVGAIERGWSIGAIDRVRTGVDRLHLRSLHRSLQAPAQVAKSAPVARSVGGPHRATGPPMPRTLPLVLLAAAAACTEPPPQRDGDVSRRPPSSFTPLIDPATFAPGGVAALAQPNASRLLDQATFGARPANGVVPPPIDSVEHVMTRSVAGAVVDLLNAPAGSFAPTPARTGELRRDRSTPRPISAPSSSSRP
jgi:hypothetical protein